MEDIFARNVPGLTECLEKSCIGIAGCGGLGSNAAAALARAGTGRLILVDFDVVELSNLNRQMYFLSDVGKRKVDRLAYHLKQINPGIILDIHAIRLTPETVSAVFASADILIEAFDRAESKTWLIQTWAKTFPDKPVISGNGLSGYGKSEEIRVTRAGNIYFCGDLTTDMSMGLSAPRVGLVANLQANTAIELLMDRGKI